MKIFIYYSLTGNGDEIADYLKDKADIRKVEVDKKDILPKNMFFRIMTGGFKALINYKDKLVNFDNDISKYSEVIIGSPVWNGKLSSPINSVLDKLDLSNKKVTFILYSGSGTSNVDKKLITKYNAKVINIKEPKKDKESIKNIVKI